MDPAPIQFNSGMTVAVVLQQSVAAAVLRWAILMETSMTVEGKGEELRQSRASMAPTSAASLVTKVSKK